MGQTVREYVDVWKRTRKVSESWKITQQGILKTHVLPFIGNTHLSELSPLHISNIMVAAEEKLLASNSRRLIFATLNRMFKDAVRLRVIKESPVVKELHKPDVTFEERVYLKPDELDRLIATARWHWAEAPIRLGGQLGLRIGEIQSLRWSDVDFDKKEVTVRSCFNRHTWMIQNWTKNGEQRIVPLYGEVLEFLAVLHEDRRPAPEELVCLSAKGYMLNYKQFRIALKVLCKKAKVPVITAHGLRHSCAELFVAEADAGPEVIRRLFGHKSLSSTQAYLHSKNMSVVVAAAERLAQRA